MDRIGGQVVLTVAQVSELLGLCRNSVYSGIRRGQIPALRIGRRVLVPAGALEAFLAGRPSLASLESDSAGTCA